MRPILKEEMELRGYSPTVIEKLQNQKQGERETLEPGNSGRSAASVSRGKISLGLNCYSLGESRHVDTWRRVWIDAVLSSVLCAAL